MAKQKSKGGGSKGFPANFKKRKDESQREAVVPSKDSREMERQQETQMEPEPMGDIFTPDRSGVSNIRQRGRQ